MENMTNKEIKNLQLRVTHFLTPIAFAFFFILILYLILDAQTFSIIGGAMLLYLISPFFGRETIIPGALLLGIPGVVDGLQKLHNYQSPLSDIVLITLSIAFVDIACSLFLIWNFDLTKKLPLIGKWIEKFERIGRSKLRKKRWIENVAFLGLFAFVILPFQGSGGINATILGRLTGMNRYKVLLSVTIGALLGSFLIAVISYYIGDIFNVLKMRGIGIIITLCAFAGLVYWYLNNKEKEKGNDIKE